MDSILEFSHHLLKHAISPGDYVIDATCGNGHDTLALAKAVGEHGHVYAFDIQKQAIKNTKKRLNEHKLLNRVELLHAGHEKIDTYFPKDFELTAAVFNLGYLPQGNKDIVTQAETTIPAIEDILNRLKKGGRMVVVIYYGHLGGSEEKEKVEAYLRQLDQKQYHVLKYEFINQKNNPPYILAVEKR